MRGERGVGHPLWQLTLARFREFMRQPEAAFWVFAFPILLALALGIAFRNRPPEHVRVAIQAGPGADSLALRIAGAPGLDAWVVDSTVAALRLRTGRVALVVMSRGDTLVFRFDSARVESRMARLVADDAIQRAYGRRDVRAIVERRVTEKGSRYIDFLLPGLLGMNLMGTGLWGVGFAVVQMRVRKLLKRLMASPMRRMHLLLAFAFARLSTVVLEVLVLVGFGVLAFDVPVRGSLVALVVIVLAGALTFSGVGLLVASRAQTVEGVSGLMNVVMMPMWVMSGIFFSSANFPDIMQPLIKVLPLTALNDALRGVMIDGVGLAATAGQLLVLAVWGTISFGIALKIFRWL